MEWRALIVLGIVYQLRWSSAATLKQLIESRDELKQVVSLIKNTELFTLDLNSDSGSTRYTIFLPENNAFNKSTFPPRLLTWMKSTSQSTTGKLEEILEYSTIKELSGLTYTTNVLGEMPVGRIESMLYGTYLFYTDIRGKGDFINGARIKEANIVATNGVLHIIDSFLWDVGRDGRALRYIENADEQKEEHFDAHFEDFKLHKFGQLLNEYEKLQRGMSNPQDVKYLLGKLPRLTMFVPSDAAIEKLTRKELQMLEGNSDQLKKVVESHLVRDEVLHTGILEQRLNENIPAEEGAITPRKFKNNFYVSNNCAQGKITRANITVSNGVIHIIDGLLGYVHDDIYTAVNGDSQLLRFNTHMFSTPGLKDDLRMQDLTQDADVDSLYTVFAPVDYAWEGRVFTQDEYMLTQTMRMHVVRGLVNIADMRDGTSKPTLRDGYPAFFKNTDEDTSVGVDYVWGKIIEGDICVKNGIIHKVDNVLGTAVDNMWDYVSDRDDLAETYRVMRNLGLDQYVKDPVKSLTFFAPTNSAFRKMRDTQRGNTLLDSRNRVSLTNVMYRHLVDTVVTLRTMGQSYDVEPEFGSFTVERDGRGGYKIPFGQFVIYVTEPDIKMANGILHVIDHVIYSEDPELDQSSGATAWHLSLVLALLSCGLKVFIS